MTSDLPVMLSASDPLTSLEEEVAAGEFDRRAHLAAAFDEVNSFVDTRLSTLQARGLQLVDEAEANLASARDAARTAFRDLALSTEETWRTARHNAVMALRKVRGALEDVERTSALPR